MIKHIEINSELKEEMVSGKLDGILLDILLRIPIVVNNNMQEKYKIIYE